MTLLSLKNEERPRPGQLPVVAATMSDGKSDGVDWGGLNHGVDHCRGECPDSGLV